MNSEISCQTLPLHLEKATSYQLQTISWKTHHIIDFVFAYS